MEPPLVFRATIHIDTAKFRVIGCSVSHSVLGFLWLGEHFWTGPLSSHWEIWTRFCTCTSSQYNFTTHQPMNKYFFVLEFLSQSTSTYAARLANRIPTIPWTVWTNTPPPSPLKRRESKIQDLHQILNQSTFGLDSILTDLYLSTTLSPCWAVVFHLVPQQLQQCCCQSNTLYDPSDWWDVVLKTGKHKYIVHVYCKSWW